MFLFLILSTNRLFILWFIIEMIIFFFIPLFKLKNKNNNSNLIKYFTIQRISSSLFLFFLITQNYTKTNIYIFNFTISITIWIKIGLFPFSNWYFQITENIEWHIWFLLNTFIKITPLWLLKNFNYLTLTSLIATINSIYSSIEIISQNSLRWLINCSSINHISWILIRFNSKTRTWEIYLVIYIILSYYLYVILKKNNIKNNFILFNSRSYYKILLSINLINFIGFPPILGFIPKLHVLKHLENIYILLPLIINNLIIIFCYFTITKSLINKNLYSKISTNLDNKKTIIINIIIILTIIVIINSLV